MKSKENFPNNSYEEQELTLETLYNKGSVQEMLFYSNMNINKDKALVNLNKAIDLYRQALVYKEYGNKARSGLGRTLHLRYLLTFDRKDLNEAIDNLFIIEGDTSGLNIVEAIALGSALFNRYLNYKDNVNDLLSARKYFEKACSEDADDELHSMLGEVYLECFYYSQKDEELQKAISLLEKLYMQDKKRLQENKSQGRISPERYVGFKTSLCFHYGVCIYERGKKEKNPNDLREAINILNEYLTIKEKDFKAYITLRGAFYSNNSKVEGNECIRTALYLLLTQRAKREPRYENIINKIPTDDLYDSLKYIQFNLPDRGLKESDVEKFFREKDFLVLLQYLHLKEQDKEVLRSKPILLFYLGGIVSSYIIFDEERDTEGEDSAMTPQEYYYYSRSALSFYDHNKTLIGADSIISSAIQNILKQKPSSDEDCYYLGQLYYLKWLKTEEEENQKDSILSSAKKWFEKCENSIWAKAMLAGISEKVLPEDVSNYIKNNCDKSQNISTAEEKESFLNQFKDYFHLHELLFAYPDLLQEIGGDLKFFEPIWKVFHLSPLDYEQVTFAIRKATGEALQKANAKLLATETSKSTPTDEENLKEELWRFPEDHNARWQEKMAQDFIKHNTSDPQKNAILLRILLDKQLINEDQFFTLFLFNKYCTTLENERKMFNQIDDSITISSILLSLLKPEASIMLDVGMFLLKKLIKVEAGNYDEFKQNLWIVMNNESTDESYFSV